jgi:uncharacterized membrane protein
MKLVFLYVMAAAYAAAGVIHFIKPGFYLSIMPKWMPSQLLLVYISGVAEIALALMLIPEITRKGAAWLIIAMLVVFFFAIHLPQAIDFYTTGNKLLWVAIVRLPVQFILIWWAWIYTKA